MSDRANRPTVRELGEQNILHRLQSFCPPGVIGDDAAVLAPEPGKLLVVTADVLVDRVHFSDQTTSAEDAGWRAAAANLSDLAAMGALPLGITVGLGLPGELAIAWVEGLYRGLTACLQRYGTAVLGGDVVRSPVTTIAITAFGQVAPDQVIRRSTAQPGQAIVVTGVHGASRAGLELLLHPALQQQLDLATQTRLMQAHQRPLPRLDVLSRLAAIFQERKVGQEPASWAIAGMDSSDGLADAVVQICRASGVGAKLERTAIPVPAGLDRWVTTAQLMQWALYGGEDFELVLCMERATAERFVAQVGQDAAIIGRTTVEPGVWLVDANNPDVEEQLTLEQGFQHFSKAADSP